MALKHTRSSHERPLDVIDLAGRGWSAWLLCLPRARHRLVPDDLGSDLTRLLDAQVGEVTTEGHGKHLYQLLMPVFSNLRLNMHATLCFLAKKTYYTLKQASAVI